MRILTRYILFDFLTVFLVTLTGTTVLMMVFFVAMEARRQGIGLAQTLQILKQQGPFAPLRASSEDLGVGRGGRLLVESLYFTLENGRALVYLPDHEPALGARRFPEEPRWTSGFDLAAGVDLLIHDGQYSDAERAMRIGWGHSSVSEAVAFAESAGVRRLILFHHDPSHSDAVIDELTEAARARGSSIEVVAGREGAQYQLGTDPRA